jgi:PAS domain S-box-containing protein
MALPPLGPNALARNDLLQAVADNVQAMLGYYTVPDLRCAFANEAYAAATGFTTTSIIGRHGSEVSGAEAWKAIAPHLEVFLQGRKVTYDRVMTLPGGERRYVESSIIPHIVEGRGFIGGFVLIHDVTERRNAQLEQALILDHSVVGIAFIRDHAFQRCNRRLEQMYGYGPGQMRGQPTLGCF